MILSWSHLDLRFPLNVCVHVELVPVWRAFSFMDNKNGTYWRWTCPQTCPRAGPTSSLVLSALHIGLGRSSCSSCIFTSSAHSVSWATLFGSVLVSGSLLMSLDASFNIWAHQSCLSSGLAIWGCLLLGSFLFFLSFSASGFFFGVMCFRWSQSTC